MMTPLTKPTAAAPPTPAMKPMRTAGNSGTPALKAARRASAESTEARLITQPTERSMPAAMMTKVWPRPSSSTGMIATRMFCELRTVRKLTEPPVVSGTAMTKNRIMRPRNDPRPDAAEEEGDALGGRADARIRRGAARRSPRPRKQPPGWSPCADECGAPTAVRPRALSFGTMLLDAPCARRLLARDLIDEAGDSRILDVVLVDDGEAGLDAPRQAGDAGGVGLRELTAI